CLAACSSGPPTPEIETNGYGQRGRRALLEARCSAQRTQQLSVELLVATGPDQFDPGDVARSVQPDIGLDPESQVAQLGTLAQQLLERVREVLLIGAVTQPSPPGTGHPAALARAGIESIRSRLGIRIHMHRIGQSDGGRDG